MPTVNSIHLLDTVLGLVDERTLWQYPGYQATCPSENGSVLLRHHWNEWEGFHHIWSESRKEKNYGNDRKKKKTVCAFGERGKKLKTLPHLQTDSEP